MNAPVPSCFAGKESRNGCAQAAVAWLLRFWEQSRSPDSGNLVRDVYLRFPPDTPLALCGTTPGGLEQICRACGFRTARFCGDSAADRLRAELAAGRPVIVLLDLARLGSGRGLHYAVAYGCDDARVYCANMLPTGRCSEPEQALLWGEFMRAWKGRLPGQRFRCAGIVAW